MSRLEPILSTAIPVHPATQGSDVQRLAVEKHTYPAPMEPVERSLAFVWSHANGFCKEMMHPLMRRFATQLRSLPAFQHTTFDFYAWDARNQDGWLDNAMDTVQVIKEMGLKKNYDKVIGVGHSFGGSAMIIAEFFFPHIFDGLCILEAVIAKQFVPFKIRSNFPAIKTTLKRRDTWPNREECFKSLSGRPFWRDLHPEVLQNFVQYALYDTQEGTVKLKCPKEEEHLVYLAGAYGSPVAFNSLKSVTVPVHMVHGDKSTFTDASTAKDIKALSHHVSSAVLDGSHMIPVEKPDALVPEIVYLTERVVMGDRAKL
ncbi:alpha/beta-hydrolase [Lichtheimia hyalospora FSU 10163]|nr:alpha/beta-hydrolase [Lichtheimia hyalospora FSU 10163]